MAGVNEVHFILVCRLSMTKRFYGKTIISVLDNSVSSNDRLVLLFSNCAALCCRWETIILISMYGVYIIIMK